MVTARSLRFGSTAASLPAPTAPPLIPPNRVSPDAIRLAYTVAELTPLVGMFDLCMVIVSDLGGAHAEWHEGDTTPANGTTVIGNTVSGRWIVVTPTVTGGDVPFTSVNIVLAANGTLSHVNLPFAATVVVTSASNFEVYGMNALTTPGAMNPIKEIVNGNAPGGAKLKLFHNSASATGTQHRFTLTGASITLNPGDRIRTSGYDYSTQRWPMFLVVGERDVREFGAVGDGSTDNWAALKAANAASDRLYFPPGVYSVEVPPAYYLDPVNGNGINVRDKTSMEWTGYGATIKMASVVPTTGRTNLLTLENCSNVSIRGLTLDGNRVGRGGGGDFGTENIFIYGGSNITLQDMRLINSCQDGVTIAAVTPGNRATYPHNIKLINVLADDNVRTGISLISCYDVELRRCQAYGSDSGLPRSGIHIEPNITDEYGVEDVRIIDCDGSDNVGEGLVITGSAPTATKTAGTGNGTVTDLSAYGSETKKGTYVLACIATAAHGGTFRLTDPDGIIITSSLVMNAGAGVATRFQAGGLQFTITDGSTDFGVGATFEIIGARSNARNIVLQNFGGRNNGAGLVTIGCAAGVSGSIISSGDSTNFSNVGYVYVSEVAHRVSLRGCNFADLTGAGSGKYVIYFDDSGIGHSLAGLRVTNCTCQALVMRDFDAIDIVLDTLTLNEAQITMADRGLVRGVVCRRVRGVAVIVGAANGCVVDNVTVYDPQGYNVRCAAANAQITNMRAFMNGNAPAIPVVYCDDAATPTLIDTVVAKATGTDYAPTGVIRFPTSKAFRLRNCRPNPLSGTKTSWNPGNLAPGDSESTTVTVTGALVGDRAFPPQHTLALQGLISTADFTATDTATLTLFNPPDAAGAVDLGSHDVTVTGEKL